MKSEKKQSRLRLITKSDGFSLIEVTIAIAITAVALVSLMGMLPAGMQTMREAADRAVETRIHQQILSEIQLANWDARYQFDYRAGAPGVHFYDDQGIEIYKTGPNALTSEDFNLSHVYTARINVPKVGQKLPSSIASAGYRGVFIPAASDADPGLQLVIVEVTSILDDAFENSSGFDDSRFTKKIRTFQATITKMGRSY